MTQRKLHNLILFLVALASWIIPKKSGKVIIFPLHTPEKIQGHLRSLLLANSSLNILRDLRAITFSPPSLEPATFLKYTIWLLNYAWDLLRAEILIIDSVRSSLGIGRFSFVQTWHGTGFKNIGLLVRGYGYMKILRYRRIGKMTRLAIASCEADKKRKIDALNLRDALVLGSPRLDGLTILKNKPKKPANLSILYAPTYRSENIAPSLLTQEDWLNKLDLLLSKIDGRLYVRLHPLDRCHLDFSSYSRIFDASYAEIDGMQILSKTDILISDFSSIVTDFSILNRPIIWFVPDLDEYTNRHRNFYYDFPNILPGPLCFDIDCLLEKLEDRSWFNEENYQREFANFVALFHARLDGRASERVLYETASLVD